MQEPINVKPFTINTPNLGAGGINNGASANPVSSFEGGNNMQDVNQGSGSSSGGSASSNPTPQTISKTKAPLGHATQQTPATVVKNP
jgi:hypothetical protein